MIVVIDFGAQYNQLIARRVRGLGIEARIVPFDAPVERVRELGPSGIILSGGPASVHAEGAPKLDRALLTLGVPVLGICYGMQALADAGAGAVAAGKAGEYGRTMMRVLREDGLFAGVSRETAVWMSHRDCVMALPADWEPLAATANCPVAAARHRREPFFGVQFHPEVLHTDEGGRMLENFVVEICAAPRTWRMGDWIGGQLEAIREQAAGRRVVAAVSGGVDSTVMAALLHRALGERLECVFIDNGLLRKDEPAEVRALFARLSVPLTFVEARERFLAPLAGVADPEEKRRIIGRVFIEVLREHIGADHLLAQGTLYPDVIESVSTHGPSATIKTHHNRVAEVLGLMGEGRIVEPLRDLFKDEVRELGSALGIDRESLERHPFPGPGLAVRVLGAVDGARLDLLREADAIVTGELKAAGLYREATWQAFAVLLPVRAVGVMGDERTYGNVVAVRAVTSSDGMTADWARLPFEVLAKISNRITNEVRGITRVTYDITSKPPGTIEWE